MTKKSTIATLTGSIAVQSLGTVSTFVLLIAVARWGGASLQGQYALMKTWLDFTVVLAQFGFPQSFIYIVNKGIASRGSLASWSFRYAIGAAVLGVVAATGTIITGYVGSYSSTSIIFVLCLGLSVGLLTYHRLIRVLLLTLSDGMYFAIFTIVPNVILAIVIILSLAYALPLEWAFLFSAIFAAAAAFWASRHFGSAEWTKIPLKQMVEKSWLMFLHASLVSALPLVLFGMSSILGASTEDIGHLSVATISIAASNAVFGMTAPIMFNRWSKGLTLADSGRLFILIRNAALCATLVVGVGIPALVWVVPAVFGNEFAPAILLMQIITAALPAALYIQVISPAFFGLGFIKPVIYASLIRVLTAIVTLLILAECEVDPVLAAAWAWCAAEWVCSVALFVSTFRLAARTKSDGSA